MNELEFIDYPTYKPIEYTLLGVLSQEQIDLLAEQLQSYTGEDINSIKFKLNKTLDKTRVKSWRLKDIEKY